MWLRVKSEFRTSWRAVVLILLLVAVGGGVALAAVAGARRTQTAMPRFLAYNRPEDAMLFFNASPPVVAARCSRSRKWRKRCGSRIST